MLFKIANKVKNNDLIRGGFILFAGSMVVNALAYVYNIVVGRMLGPENFGIFSSLVALVYIISVFSSTLSLLVAKFSAQYQSKDDYGSIVSLFQYTTKKFLIVGSVIFIFFAAIAPLISSFLKINSIIPVIILGISFVLFFLVAINRGILQGLLKFTALSVNTNMEMVLRIVISVIFIYWGLKVNGALLGLTLGILVSYILSFIPLKKTFQKSKAIGINTHLLKKYALPLFVSFLGMTLLYTIDIILVKHYLDDYNTGIYSALSTFGKIVFFSSSAVATALFPMAAEKKASGKEHFHLLRDSVIAVLIISGFISALYFLIPDIIVKFLFGNEFIDASKYLGLFGLIMFFYSIVNIAINYYLSINKTNVAYLPFLFSAVLILLIIFFHRSIQEILYIRVIHMAILLISVPIFNILTAKKYVESYPGVNDTP